MVIKKKRRSAADIGKYYVIRVQRIKASPYAVAMGVGLGLFIAVNPLLGTHTISIIILCFIFRANMVAGVLASLLGAWSFILWPMYYITGTKIADFVHGLHDKHHHGHVKIHHHELDFDVIAHDIHTAFSTFDFHMILHDLAPVLKALTIGSLPFSAALGGIMFTVTYIFLKKRKAPKINNEEISQ